MIDEGMCDTALITTIHKSNSVGIPGKSVKVSIVKDKQIKWVCGGRPTVWGVTARLESGEAGR